MDVILYFVFIGSAGDFHACVYVFIALFLYSCIHSNGVPCLFFFKVIVKGIYLLLHISQKPCAMPTVLLLFPVHALCDRSDKTKVL